MVAETCELAQTPAFGALGVETVEVVGAQFVIGGAGGKDVKADLEDVATDGDDRFVVTAYFTKNIKEGNELWTR